MKAVLVLIGTRFVGHVLRGNIVVVAVDAVAYAALVFFLKIFSNFFLPSCCGRCGCGC